VQAGVIAFAEHEVIVDDLPAETRDERVADPTANDLGERVARQHDRDRGAALEPSGRNVTVTSPARSAARIGADLGADRLGRHREELGLRQAVEDRRRSRGARASRDDALGLQHLLETRRSTGISEASSA
jgi:hypothetical protein